MSAPAEQDLRREGWTRGCIADEPRLSEAAQTYRELGFEVRLLPVSLEEEACSECLRLDSERFRVIYFRRSGDEGEPGGGA